jgi:hypothetical protein
MGTVGGTGDYEIGDEYLEYVGRLNGSGRITDGEGAIIGLDEVWMNVFRLRSALQHIVLPRGVGGQRQPAQIVCKKQGGIGSREVVHGWEWLLAGL